MLEKGASQFGMQHISVESMHVVLVRAQYIIAAYHKGQITVVLLLDIKLH